MWRNRLRIVEAARAEFATGGVDASYEEIARRAGLGSATVYRHFPTRYALLAEVLRTQVTELCNHGRALLQRDDPAESLHTWLTELLGLASERGLADALLRTERRETEGFFDECHAEIIAVASALLARCRQAGYARDDVEPGDVVALVSMIASGTSPDHARTARPDSAAAADRLLALAIHGIRRGP